jgi:hypothetical protein
MDELESMLLSRKYNRNIVKAAIQKAKNIPRTEALKRVQKKPNDKSSIGNHLPSKITKHFKNNPQTLENNDKRLYFKKNFPQTTDAGI